MWVVVRENIVGKNTAGKCGKEGRRNWLLYCVQTSGYLHYAHGGVRGGGVEYCMFLRMFRTFISGALMTSAKMAFLFVAHLEMRM
jgi:hypothetical protein